MANSSYRRNLQWARLVLYGLVFFFLVDVFRLRRAYRTFSSKLITQTVYHVEDLPREVQQQKIYIAIQFWTSADVLAEFWLTQFLKLIKELGRDNVYVSILESGSLDNTADAIQWLHQELITQNVPCTVIIDPTTHEDVVKAGSVDEQGRPKEGWIVTSDTQAEGTKALRRIPYLSDLRNRGLAPLIEMHRRGEQTFDKILYLNDVYFEPSDIMTLLATNSGYYDVACGLDFIMAHVPIFYDIFVLRDTEGRGALMNTFPFFQSSESRNSILQGAPSKVTSCWNGVLVVDAAPYYDRLVPKTSGSGHQVSAGLRFRAIPDSLALHYVEASECCLIHADLIASGHARKGIFVNPAVRTGYTTTAYQFTHQGPDKGFVSGWQYVTGVWRNRLRRWRRNVFGDPKAVKLQRRIRQWQDEVAPTGEKRYEVGDYCIANEMQILLWNGWKNVWEH